MSSVSPYIVNQRRNVSPEPLRNARQHARTGCEHAARESPDGKQW
jgi:hypothetical protein